MNIVYITQGNNKRHMSNNVISEGDRKFIVERALPYFGVEKINIRWSSSFKKYPDIWLSYRNGLPVITVTREWKRQSPDERRKRIVHEFLHITGMQHDRAIGYSTYPNQDTFSMRVYRDIIR